MDKKMKRVVGFVRTSSKSEISAQIKKQDKPVAVEVKEEKSVLVIPDLNMLLAVQNAKSSKIIKWITEHEEFKWGAMCTKLEIDRGNFQRVLKNKKSILKADLIPKIELFLKLYGYAE